MKNLKLSKQTIFTLLGLLVIVASIPLAVILVKQRQEIRKEAAECSGSIKCCAWKSGVGSELINCSTINCRADTTRGCYAPCPSGTEPVSGSCYTTTDASVYPPPPPPVATPTPTPTPETDCQCSDTTYCRRHCPDGKCGECESKCGCCPEDCGGGGTTPTPGGGGSAPAWGFWATGVNCAVTPTSPPPPPPTPTPTKPIVTPTPTITPTVTPTLTPTPTITKIPTPTPTVTVTPTPTPTGTGTPTPTPTIPVGCDQTCNSDANCTSGLICYNSRCRNSNCPSETDCTCPGPTPTPTATSTPGPTTTPATVAQVTPTPVVELPQAGFALPTFGAIIGGLLLIAISLIFIL